MKRHSNAAQLLLVSALCLFVTARPAPAGNPIVVGQGVTDPKIRIYNGKIYLYATHDAIPGNPNGFLMNDWWVLTSTDLVIWTHASTLKPEDTYWRKPCDECWATDAISHKGKYYFYFSRGSAELGVVVSDTPTGPWTDPLGKPFVPQGSTPTEARDPAILQEDDGTTYVVFGVWDYYIARLNDDMITLAEKPRKLELDRKFGPYGEGKTDDKSYLHKYNGKYYLSWGCYYAMSDNVYGPYVYKGCLITKERTEPVFQKGLTMDRHGSFFELHHQWYFICNDQSWPGATPFYRDSVLSYVHYRDNGEIEPIYLKQIGVGQYDAAQSPIEAENYFDTQGTTQGECPEGGFEVRGIRNASYLLYPNVMNIPANARVSFRYSSGNASGGIIEIHAEKIDGPLLGTCAVPSTGSWTTYHTVECTLNNPAGKKGICLVFRGATGELLRLNWFGFKPS